jgi:hypothetical protein
VANKLLIIGKTPPPIGGVTIHVKRLLDGLKVNGFNFRYLPLTPIKLLTLCFILPRYSVLHLHTSSIIVQRYISVLCKITSTKCIITFHGDLNRFAEKDLKKVEKVLKTIDIPIVLNKGSFNIAKGLNTNTIKISSFIPPFETEELSGAIKKLIYSIKEKYKHLYVTNAYGLTYDKYNNEIYGIFDLINHFNNKADDALVVSDPSSQYLNYIVENKIKINDNIFFINEHHSFYELLKHADASIRNTSTDGDSISLRESLHLKKVTFATDIVSRPSGTRLYKRGEYNFDLGTADKDGAETESLVINQLIKIYKEIQ